MSGVEPTEQTIVDALPEKTGRDRGQSERPLMRPGLRRGLKWAGLIIGGALAVAVYAYVSLGWADLRTDTVLDGIDATETARGRELLQRVAEAHGLARFEQHTVVEIAARDDWPGGGGWWPVPDQRIRTRRLLGTFTSLVEFVDGPSAGRKWGLQSWTPYTIDAGGRLQFVEANDSIEFYLPTLHYFDELPFRLLRAPIVTDAGRASLNGQGYERVFVTWDDPEPHEAHDQYLLWIDPETDRLVKATYTVREAGNFGAATMRPAMRAFGVGTIHYSDYRLVAGVLFPHAQHITIGTAEQAPGRLEEDYFHRVQVDTVLFDGFDPATLTPDTTLAEGGDNKGPIGS